MAVKELRALEIVIKRLCQEDGLFDIEACWTIGVLASALDISNHEVVALSKSHSHFRFTYITDSTKDKVLAVKVVREHLDIGLKEAKEIVEGKHPVIDVSSYTANSIKERCERECGSRVTVTLSPPQETD